MVVPFSAMLARCNSIAMIRGSSWHCAMAWEVGVAAIFRGGWATILHADAVHLDCHGRSVTWGARLVLATVEG